MKGFWYDNPVSVQFYQEDYDRRIVHLLDADGEDLIPPATVGDGAEDDVFEMIGNALNAMRGNHQDRLRDLVVAARQMPDAVKRGTPLRVALSHWDHIQ